MEAHSDFAVEIFDNYTLITVKKDKLDNENAPILKAELVQLSDDEGARNIIIDMSGCKYCDSSGLSAVLVANRLCKNSDGMLVVAGAFGAVSRLFMISQLESEIPMTDTVKDAIKYMHPDVDPVEKDEVDQDELIIDSTAKTPLVQIDAKKGTIVLDGRIIPEDSNLFFEPILDFIAQKFAGLKEIHIKVQVEYANTMASHKLLELLKLLNRLHQSGATVRCDWLYEEDDYDMLDMGEDYKKLVEYPFEFVEVEV